MAEMGRNHILSGKLGWEEILTVQEVCTSEAWKSSLLSMSLVFLCLLPPFPFRVATPMADAISCILSLIFFVVVSSQSE